MSKEGDFSGQYFPAFSPYLDTFHAVGLKLAEETCILKIVYFIQYNEASSKWKVCFWKTWILKFRGKRGSRKVKHSDF